MARRPRRSASTAPGAGDYKRDEEEFEQEDEEENYEAPRRSRRGRDDEEAAPRRGRRAAAEDEDDDARDDSIVGSGWDDFESSNKGGGGGGDYPDRISLNEDDAMVLVKFLEDRPFAVYDRHWVGGRSYTCYGDECPLCDIGDEATTRAAFNVAVFLYDVKGNGDPEEYDPPEVMVYDAAPTVTKQLKKFNEDERKGPLTAQYWEIIAEKGKGGKGFTKHNFNLVKERDLEEDWEVTPLSDDEFDELVEDFLWTTKQYPYRGKLEDLEEVAENVSSSSGRGRDEDDRPSRGRRGRR